MSTEGKGAGKRPRSSGKALLKILISGVLLVFLLTQIDIRSVGAVLAHARWIGVWAALALFVAGIFIRAYRWQILLDDLNLRVPLSTLSAWYFVGGFFNTVLPTGFGGDAVKAAELARYTKHGGEAVGSVIVDRFLGIVVLLAIGVAALALGGDWVDSRVAWLIALLLTGSLAGFWLLRRRELMRRLSRLVPESIARMIREPSKALYAGLESYSKRSLARALVVSLLFNATWIGVNVLLGWALGISASLQAYLVFVPLVSLSLLLPTLGGLGARELTYVGLFGLIGVAEAQAFALSILVYGITVVAGLIGGLVYLVQGAREYGPARQ
jgi:uncharacterized protein (TIRG00374 family)